MNKAGTPSEYPAPAWVSSIKESLTEVICLLYIVLFVYAAASKLIDYRKFEVQLMQSPLLTLYAAYIVWLIPLLEIGMAILLAVPKTRLVGLYGAYFIMSAFTCYIIAILKYSEYVPCSCGGILETMGWTEHLWFNIFFMAFAILGILVCWKRLPGRKQEIQLRKRIRAYRKPETE